jgi:hypothetical protein
MKRRDDIDEELEARRRFWDNLFDLMKEEEPLHPEMKPDELAAYVVDSQYRREYREHRT